MSASDLNRQSIRRFHPQRSRLSAAMGPPLDRPGHDPDRDILVVELPDHLPILTPGLARALMRAITSAARSAGLVEDPDTEEPEAIAS